jgi:hypothetical protein
LEGTNFFTNRKERMDAQLGLVPFGIINHQKIASAMGMLPQDFERQLAMTKAGGFVDGLTPIISAFQAGGEAGGKTAGRPSKGVSDVKDEGGTRANGSNVEKGGNE